MRPKNIYLTLIILLAITAKAQQGFGTSNPAPSSVIDMVAGNKGALLPRVTLTSILDISTVPSPANSLTVFNTATAGTAPNNVIPGYYYWSTSASKWIRLMTASDTTTSNASSANTATITVNGITSTGAPIINTNTTSLSGTNLITTVNGVASTALNLQPAITAGTTHTLTNPANTITSIVNGVNATALAVNTVANNITGDALTTTVNGVSSTSIDLSGFKVEPWQVQNSTIKSTTNAQNIYQTGKVAVGDFSTGITTKKFEVKGDFKSEITIGSNITGIEVNTPLLPQASGSYWMTPAGQIHSIVAAPDGARATAIDNMAAPAKISNFTVDINSVNAYSKHNGEAKQSTLQLNGNQGMFALYANEYATNWGAMIKSDTTNGLLLYHGGSNTSDNVNSNDKTEIIIKKADGITFEHHGSTGTLTSAYKFPLTTGTTGQIMTQSGVGGRITWSSPSSIVQEPWNVIGSPAGTQATTNTQNIYQIGNIAIGKNQVGTGVTLDVKGAVRTGDGHLGVTGVNSVAFGSTNEASGNGSAAFGINNIDAAAANNKAIGINSVTFGSRNTVSGTAGAAFGSRQTVSGINSVAFGVANNVSGDFATAFGNSSILSGGSTTTFGQENKAIGYGATITGIWNTAATPWETIVGFDNAITTSSLPAEDLIIAITDDPLFQIGNGQNNSTSRNNALTVLRNGKVGIGIIGTEAAAKPTETFDVGTGGVKIRAINTTPYTGTLTTPLVASTATGTVGTAIATDRILVADTNGILKTVSAANVALESWLVQSTTTQATTPGQNIFHTGKVAIGRNTMFTTTEMLAVNGSIRTISNVYADYVFENYFKGKSKIKTDYKFKTLKEVESYIKQNNHLPGVTPIKDLIKTTSGYSFNLTELSVQSLEKLEELYLHVIEQQKQIDAKDKEIKELKNQVDITNKRLEKLEKALSNN